MPHFHEFRNENHRLISFIVEICKCSFKAFFKAVFNHFKAVSNASDNACCCNVLLSTEKTIKCDVYSMVINALTYI